MSQPTVLIVGAGPTGMTLAIELRRAGLPVRIIDKSSHAALHSQALVVQARTLEQLQRYGIAETAISRGRKLTRTRLLSDGNQIFQFELNKIPSRYPYLLFLPQSETEHLLKETMEALGVRIERQTELLSFAQDETGITARIRLPDGTEEQASARWIVGCDGAHSKVRELAQIPFEGKGIGLSFLLGDLEINGPDAPGDEIVIHLHRGGDLVFMGRLSDKFTRVIVALHEAQNSQQHQQQEPHQSQRELTIQDFQVSVDRIGVKIKVHSSDWMTPFYVNDRQASQYRVGNAFLAGDASHIHSPVGGQGMNTGMQDAANLAWKLAAVGNGADPALLDSYGEERQAVGRALLEFTETGLGMATSHSHLLESIRDAVLPIATRLDLVQKRALGFVSETAIHYRDSSIVQDHGGDGTLRAGDRMPDIGIGQKDNAAGLLAHWTESKPLALLVNPDEDEEQQMCENLSQTKVISLHGVDLDDSARSLLGTEKKLLILRPDGYIGFRSPLHKVNELESWEKKNGVL